METVPLVVPTAGQRYGISAWDERGSVDRAGMAWLVATSVCGANRQRYNFELPNSRSALTNNYDVSDYLHLTKRFGIVGASQLPWHYLLAMKSSHSPLLLLTRRSHEKINGIHQHLGRITVTLFYLHAGFYLNFYVLSVLLIDKLKQAYVLCGVLAFFSFTVIGTTALAPLRKRYYKIFYLVHIILAMATLPLLYFHVSHIRVYLYETLGIFVLNAVLRAWNTTTLLADIRMIEGTDLVEIEVALPRSKSRQWHAGSHAYISLAGSLFRAGSNNPFSVASNPALDSRLIFVARVLDGNTTKLAKAGAEQRVTRGKRSVSIEGPYGVSTHLDALITYDRVLFIAGGVGATFTVPLYRQLLADLSPSKGSRRRQRVSFLWICRSVTDTEWAIPVDQKEREGFMDRMRVCVTSQVEGLTTNSSLDMGGDDFIDSGEALLGGSQSIEMEESSKLIRAWTEEGELKQESQGLQLYAGRPDVSQVIDQAFAFNPRERIAILVCGPKSLSQAVRREVTRYICKGREVWFWDESFAL